jgi:hypothetical protein
MRSLQNKTILLTFLLIIIINLRVDFFLLILPQTNTNKNKMKKIIALLFFFYWSSGNYKRLLQYKEVQLKLPMQKHCLAAVLAIHTQRDQVFLHVE